MANKDPKKSIKELNEELGYVEDQVISIAEQLATSVKNAIEDIKDEAAGVADIFSKNLNRSIKDIAKESDKILANTLKLATGEAKISDIQKSQFNLQLKQLATQRNLDTLFKQGLITEQEKLKAEQEIEEAIGSQNALLKDQLEQAKKIQKNMGITGNIIKGINKIPILGNFINAERVLAKAQLEASKEGSSRTKVMSSAFKELGSSLKHNLTDPLILMGVGLKVFDTLKDIGFEYSQITADIARNQGISSDAAERTQDYLRDAASSSTNLLATTKNFAAATTALNDSFGTSADFSTKTLENFTDLTKKLGLTNEEASALAGFSLTTGKTSEQIVNNIGKQNKGVISNKKVISEVAKINGQLYAQYKGSPDLLAKAVIQTQKLGMTLQQAQNASKSLLNFEESISAELEAELLTGRDLNLEKARYLALQGDSAGAAEELMKNVGSLQNFTKLNVIQQEALARAVGMSADELTDSLRKQEQLKKLNQGQVSLYKKQIDELREKGKMEEADALEKQMFQQKDFELSKLQLSAQEKLSAASDKLKDTFSAIVAGPVGGFVSKFVDIIAKIASTKLGQIALGGAAIVGLGAAILAMTRVFGKMALTGAMPVTIVGGGLGGGGGVGDMVGGLGGGRSAGLGKQLKTLVTKPRVFGRALMRGGAGSMLGSVGSKALAGITSVGMTGKGLYDFFSEEKNRSTGIGGFFENLGGTGAQILDKATFGLTKSAFNATGISIPGMETDDVASARAIFHASGRDPDDSRFPISMDNKQLINDILKNPGAYPEGIVQQAQGVNITELAMGGMVTRPTNALIGEAGPEAVIPLNKFYSKFDELIGAVSKGGNVYLDSNKVGTAMNVGTFKLQ